MNRCHRCILPDTLEGLRFEQGLCECCRDYQAPVPLGREALEGLIAEKRQPSRPYDAIVPLSGGRDSSYILYYACQQLDLRVLAVFFDNEFCTPEAAANVRRAAEKMGVALEIVRSKQQVVRKSVRSLLTAASVFGHFSLCRPCVYGYRSAVYRAAEAQQVPLILWGDSPAEATQLAQKKAFDALTLRGEGLPRHLRPGYYLSRYYSYLERREFPVAGNSPFKRGKCSLHDPSITEVRFFDYVPWDRQAIKEAIARHLDWQKPADRASTWRADCYLHEFINYYHYVLLGCTKDAFGYCNMINAGEMTREQALSQELATIQQFPIGVPTLLRDRIGLPPREVDRLMSYYTSRSDTMQPGLA